MHPQQVATSGGSGSESSSAEGPKRRESWIKSLGRRRRGSTGGADTSRSRSRGKRGTGGDRGGSSDDSGEDPLTSGSSDEGERDDDEDGLLLGKRAR